MPITVEHGSGDISGLMQLALAAGAANRQMPRGVGPVPLPSGANFSGFGRQRSAFESVDKAKALQAQVAMKNKEIQARAAMQKEANEAAAKRAGVAAGLEKEMQQIEYDQQVELNKQKAIARANEIQWTVTADMKKDAAKNANRMREVDKAVKEGLISRASGDNVKRALLADIAGDNVPIPMPAGEKPPTLQEQTEIIPGVGAFVPSSSGPRHIPHKSTIEGIKEERRFQEQSDWRDSRRSYSEKLLDMTIDDNSAEGGKRSLNTSEIQDRLNKWDAINPSPDGDQAPGMPKELERGELPKGFLRRGNVISPRGEELTAKAKQAEKAQENFYKKTEREGLKIGKKNMAIKFTEVEKTLPPEIGGAHAIFRTMEEKFKSRSEMTFEEKQIYDAASQVVKQIIPQM